MLALKDYLRIEIALVDCSAARIQTKACRWMCSLMVASSMLKIHLKVVGIFFEIDFGVYFFMGGCILNWKNFC
ncbi:hypothetical protein CISIN_1g045680mg [Citrus sinensis]|uniref:Uncharacterized protein n=1 Tax=Citrus sinensis TaxID=2711 RepID=A0A067D533_CITSI|nr:hypothetical protein CISIN_1g045680mg [Citrus sinensis]